MLHYNFIFFTLIISFALSQQSQVTHTQVHFNGNIKSITNNVKHGKGIQKWSREEYDKYGNKHGAWIGWDENGLMSYETVWEFGIYRQYREWYRDGSKKLVRKYDDEGNLTDMKKWDKKGNEIIETLSLYGQ